MRVSLWRRLNLKLAAVFFICLAAMAAQDSTSYLTPDVLRVGQKLACKCGGCRNTVGNCPMIHCSSSDPKRKRIYEMLKAGMSDQQIVNTFVREEGVSALSSPPTDTWGGLVSWAMPGFALLIGFWIWLRYVRGNQQEPVPLTEHDRAAMERFRSELEGDPEEREGVAGKPEVK